MYSQKALHAVQWKGDNIKDIDVFCQECGYHYGKSLNKDLTLVLESNDYKHTLALHINEMLYFKGNNPKLHAMPAREFRRIHQREN